jgi:16S rRNA (guanine1207-N2)-methyltransferase
MSLTAFRCFSGTYTLERHPPPAPQQPLQAWDAADEYLLSAVAPLLPGQHDQSGTRVLIINDQFGALAVALHAYQPHSWGDSFTARLALEQNLRRNDLPDTVTFVPATTTPPGLPGKDGGTTVSGPGYDVVLWRAPKSRALFEQQRAALQPLLHADTLVLAGGMVKHLTDRAKDVLSQLGTVAVYPVQKKAVLLQLTPQPDLPPLPVVPETVLAVPKYDLQLASGPNVFAHEKIDSGAQFFLEQFAHLPQANRIADLGCGNGILGIAAKRLQPTAELHFFDESYQAVAAAQENYHRNGLDAVEPAAQFHVDDGLTHYTGDAFDLVLCNPPFHQGHVIDDQIALRMLTQSKRHLRGGGELWIVGNRHLEYHIKLRRLFGSYRQIAAHPRFVVLATMKP